MRSLFIIVSLLVFVTVPSFAGDKMLQVCIVGGYFSGAQDKFMSGLATHMLEEKGVLGAASCSSAWRNAYDVGVSFSKSGKIANSSEAEVVKHAAEFSAKVYSSVAKGMTP